MYVCIYIYIHTCVNESALSLPTAPLRHPLLTAPPGLDVLTAYNNTVVKQQQHVTITLTISDTHV